MSMGIHAGKADTIDIRNQTVIASPELLKYKKRRLNKTSISKKNKIIYTLYLTISRREEVMMSFFCWMNTLAKIRKM